jgi:hypothetical protein
MQEPSQTHYNLQILLLAMQIESDDWAIIADDLKKAFINPKCIPEPWDAIMFCFDEATSAHFELYIDGLIDPSYVYTHSVNELTYIG